MSQSMQNYKYTSKLRSRVKFCNDFFGGDDIDLYQLNLRPLKNLHFLVEKPLKKGDFLHFLNNKCIINFYKKKKDFIGDNCIFFHFFGLVMCHEPQT